MVDSLTDAILADDVQRVIDLVDEDPARLQARLPADERLGDVADCTPLHVAVRANSLPIASLLISRGVHLDLCNSEGRTALHDAIETGADDLVELLLESGAEVDINAAAIMGDLDRLLELLQEDEQLVNDRSTNLTPLGWAAFGNQPEIALELLARGAEVNNGELLCAASVGHVDVARVLLEHGADPNRFDKRAGGTALHAAVSMRYSTDSAELVELLLEMGAEPDIKTESGMTAVELAEYRQRQQAEEEQSGEGEPPVERNFAAVIEVLRAYCDARDAGCDEVFGDFDA